MAAQRAPTLSFDDDGPREGLPVVLLHGFPLSRAMWEPQAAALAARGFRVVRPDLPGHGHTPPAGGEPSMGGFADAVLSLLDHLRIDGFVLAGFSMGGYVALEVQRRAPGRVVGLVLVDTRAGPDSDEAKRGRLQSVQRIRRGEWGGVVDELVGKGFAPASRSDRPKLIAEVREAMLRTTPAGAAEALLAMASRPDHRVRLSGVRIPTLVVVGQEDGITPPKESHVMTDSLPHAALRIVPAAGHFLPFENPDALTAAFVAWLEASVPGFRAAVRAAGH